MFKLASNYHQKNKASCFSNQLYMCYTCISFQYIHVPLDIKYRYHMFRMEGKIKPCTYTCISIWRVLMDISYMDMLFTFNSFVPGRFDCSLKLVNFKFISMINILSIFCEIAIRSMPQYLTDHESTLVQVMAWCRQATSHYLSQCWPRSMSPHGVTRPQWVKSIKN